MFTTQLLSSAAGCLHVNTTTHHLVDSYQRERYFHGVNVVVKEPPWMPQTEGGFDPFRSFVEEDMELLQEYGLNAIRLGQDGSLSLLSALALLVVCL